MMNMGTGPGYNMQTSNRGGRVDKMGKSNTSSHLWGRKCGIIQGCLEAWGGVVRDLTEGIHVIVHCNFVPCRLQPHGSCRESARDDAWQWGLPQPQRHAPQHGPAHLPPAHTTVSVTTCSCSDLFFFLYQPVISGLALSSRSHKNSQAKFIFLILVS